MPRISVITPSVRPEALVMVYKCLERQTFKDFDWWIVGPRRVCEEAQEIIPGPKTFRPIYFVEEPDKRKGDYYSLNKAWNQAFREVDGDLIVSIVDGLWFPPDVLETLHAIYVTNPKACVTTIGHQYDQIEDGKPEHMVWRDPRARHDLGSFYEVGHNEMELCVASFPRQAVFDVGGVDEEFDRYAALSEKEMMARMYKAGYTLWINQNIEYRAIQHPRLNEAWEEHFQKGVVYYNKCMEQIAKGKRMTLTYI